MKAKWVPSTVVFLMAIIVSMGMTACKKNRQDRDNDARINELKQRRAEIQKQQKLELDDQVNEPEKKKKIPAKSWIKSIALTPKNSKEGTSILVEVETYKPLMSNQYLTYIYWKGGKKSAEKKENIIPSEFYKKGDLISAEVLFHQRGDDIDPEDDVDAAGDAELESSEVPEDESGEQTPGDQGTGPEDQDPVDDAEHKVLEKKRSDPIFVSNTTPVISKITFPKISGEGSYNFEVTAEDHDEDKLTFSLSPAKEGDTLPEGLTINKESGTVTYVLGKKNPPKILTFIISADDLSGGIAKKMVSMPFATEKAVRQVDPNKKKGEKDGKKAENK